MELGEWVRSKRPRQVSRRGWEMWTGWKGVLGLWI